MSRKPGDTSNKPKKTALERFSLKIDKIISILIQMKPIASDMPERKAFVYEKLSEFLNYQKESEKNV